MKKQRGTWLSMVHLVPNSFLILHLLASSCHGYNVKSLGHDSLARVVRRSTETDYLDRMRSIEAESGFSSNITGYFSSENGDLSFLEKEIAKGSAKEFLARSPRKSSCIIWSGSHLRTFDGITFTLQLTNHILMQTNNVNGFKLWINENDELTFTEKSSIEEPFVLTFDKSTKKPVLKKGKETYSIPGVIGGMILEQVGQNIVFINIPGIGLKIKWNTNDQFIIEANENLWNKTLSGICGNYDGNPFTDFTLQDGNTATNIDELFESWSLEGMSPRFGAGGFMANPCSSETENNEKAIQFCGKILTSPTLERCHHVINGYSFYQTCRWDYCAGNIDRACQSVELFVSWCQDYGNIAFTEGWRSPDFCPFECDTGLEYSICGTGDSLTCQDAAHWKEEEYKPTAPPTNIVTYSGFQTENEYCIEGCYCPKGTFMHEGNCIQRKECPCTFNGIEFLSGQTIYQECNQCQCEAGNWICTEKLCGRSCSYYGQNHITTFDGKDFSFRTLGSFLMVKDADIAVYVNTCKNPQDTGSSSSAYIQDNYHVSFITIKAYGEEILLNDNFQLSFNGAYVPQLPFIFTTSDGNKIFITKDTSLFIGLSFSNGFKIKWNGHSRIYIHAPASAFGQVKGLCGNYNKIQKDDFVTPEGEIESVNEAFVSSWQTNSCTKSPSTPDSLSRLTSCSLSIEKKKEYSNYCALLKSNLFKECHWAVDPSSFYKDCLNDICHCNDQNNAFNCLCPILSHYAQVCSSKGIYLEAWRQSVNPCSVSCDNGQKYSVCHKDCHRTCSDVSKRNSTCEESSICVEGCACPEGMVLNDQHTCVPISQCPCPHFFTGEKINPGVVKYNPKIPGREHCTCKSGLWKCRNLENDLEKRKMKASLITCDRNKNLVFKECISSATDQPTCTDLDSNGLSNNSNSCDYSGCVCRDGFILPTKDAKECIPKKKCPCHHGGKSYEEGKQIKQDCNTCVCNSGKWTCTERVCPAICTAWGDSHYVSFDGKMFDFKGKCEYIMAQYKGSSKDSFLILVQNIPCGTSNVTCSKRITIKIGNTQFQEKIVLNHNMKDLSNDFYKRMNVRKAGLFTFVDVYDLGFTVQWDGSNRVYLRIKPFLKGLVQGLCGNANEDEEDDFKGPSGIIETFPTTFGDSWRVHKYCPEATEVEDECELNPERRTWSTNKCSVLHSDVFEPCHSEVDWEPWYKKCLSDACGCNVGGDCECLCTAISAYAHECTRAGVPISWRKQSLCPMQCPHHSGYESCVNTCPVKTCKDLIVEKASSLACEDEYCVEGCQPDACPKDHLVYLSNEDFTCVDPNKCEKPKCIVDRNQLFYEGDVMESDECHNCTCSRGQKICHYSSSEECESSYEGSTLFPKLDYSTTSPLTIINNTNLTYLSCHDGWSGWMNTNSPSALAPNDEENVQDFMNNAFDISQGYCSPEHMIGIQCRSAITGETAASNNDYTIECDTKKGLKCQVNNPGVYSSVCDDFEYRVKCECIASEVNGTVELETCDIYGPPLAIEDQCNLYKECVPLGPETPAKYEIKSCEHGLFFNPKEVTCDWPDNVIHVRPDCQVNEPDTGLVPNATVCIEHPHQQKVAHETNCSNYYVCYDDNEKLQYGGTHEALTQRKAKLKSCTQNYIFNTDTLVCDSPLNVYPNRPECKPSTPLYTTDSPFEGGPTTPMPPFGANLEEDPTACVKNNTHSLLDHPVKGEVETKVSSIKSDSAIEDLKLEDDTPTFEIKKVETIPESNTEERPSESKFAIDLCNSEACCSIDPIKSVDSLEGNELEECKDFDIGTDSDVHVKVKHLNDINGELKQIKLTDDDNQVIHCDIQDIFEGQVSRDYGCSEPVPPLDEIIFTHASDPNGQSTSYRPEEYEIEICKEGFCCDLDYIHDLVNVKESRESSELPEDCKQMALSGEEVPEVKVEYNGPGYNTLTSLDLLNNDETQFTCELVDSYTEYESKKYACKKNENLEDAEEKAKKCWKPHPNDLSPYVEYKFDEETEIYGLTTKGGDNNHFVSSYHLLLGNSEDSLQYVEDDAGVKKVFMGNSDGTTPKNSYLNPPISAKILRVVPLTWSEDICMKIDVIGCGESEEEDEEDEVSTAKPFGPLDTATTPKTSVTPEDECRDRMGISDNKISAKQILVSSVKNGDDFSYGKERLRLSNGGSWQPDVSNRQQFVIIDFGDERLVKGVVLKGDSGKYIKSFQVMYSNDRYTWEDIRDDNGEKTVFHGNYDDKTVSERLFDKVIRMRYFKLVPVSWARKGISLQMELIGCFKPYGITDSPTKTTPLFPPGSGKTPEVPEGCAKPCPNLPNFNYESDCHSCGEYERWNGTQCVDESNCDCYDGYIKRRPGDIFINENCDNCICRVNGEVHCTPKKCPKCYEENEFAFTTPRCGCICKTCTKEERYCPTSKKCIPADKWCDGVVDCADDETECSETDTKSTVSGTTPPSATDTPPIYNCPPEPKCPSGARLRQTEIESPIGCPLSKCECLDPTCPEGLLIKYDNSGPETYAKSSKPMRFEFFDSYGGGENTFSNSQNTNGDLEADDSLFCPKYKCVAPPTKAECTIDGPNVNTFDKSTFKLATCQVVLAVNENENWNISLIKTCQLGCQKSLVIQHGDDSIVLNHDFSIDYKNVHYPAFQVSKMSDFRDVKIRIVGDSNMIFESKIHPLKVSWSKFGKVEIRTDTTNHDELKGLCGAFNGDPSDDLRKENGEVTTNVNEFVESWENGDQSCMNVTCPIERQRRALELCKTFKYPPFDNCQGVLDIKSITSHCVEDMCTCLEKSDDDIRECRCEAQNKFVNQCLQVNKNIDLSRWRIDHFCPANCPEGKVMRDCYDASCQTKCGDKAVDKCIRDPEAICFSGCFCSDDEVLSSDGNSCIPKKSCKDCVCEGNGYSQFKNFDDTEFDLDGNCSYIAVRHDNGDFEIQIENEECRDDTTSFCVKSIIINTADNSLRIAKDDRSPDGVYLYERNKRVESVHHSSNWFQSRLSPGGKVFVNIYKFDLEIIYKIQNGGFSIKYSSFTHGGKTDGLCGNCNNDPNDDFTKRDNAPSDNLKDFIKSWSTKSCSSAKIVELPKVETCINEDNSQCDRLGRDTFSACHPLVPVEQYINHCKKSYCKRENYTICNAFEDYSEACFDKGGLCISWRQKEHCPSSLKCSLGLEYRECSEDACEKTCDDILSQASANTYNTPNEKCDMNEPEGCYCPEGMVLNKNRKCVKENYCHTCTDTNGTEYHLDEEWHPSLCKSCTCTEIGTTCIIDKCIQLPCPVGQKSVEHHEEGKCCPQQTCVPIVKNCTTVKSPECESDYQVKKIQTTEDECPTYVCECIPRDECSELEPEEELEIGEKYVLKDNGCCEHRQKVCDPSVCPSPIICPRFYEVKKIEHKCCPEYSCETPNACIDEFYGNLHQIGDEWQEGECKNCSCIKPNESGKPVTTCSVQSCLPLPPKDEDYLYKKITPERECCPVNQPIKCIHNETEIRPGESIKEMKGNVCKIYECQNTPNGGVKKSLELVEKCSTNCPIGSNYTVSSDDVCCGKCVPYACSAGDHIYHTGHDYVDQCVTRKCIKLNETYILSEKTKDCPDISKCPQEFLVDDEYNCCKVCNITIGEGTCEETLFPSEKTIGLIQEFDLVKGTCKNKEVIPDYQQCSGFCESRTVYVSPLESHRSDCKCCQTLTEKSLNVRLTCENGVTYTKTVKVPEHCGCTACGSSLGGGGRGNEALSEDVDVISFDQNAEGYENVNYGNDGEGYDALSAFKKLQNLPQGTNYSQQNVELGPKYESDSDALFGYDN